MRWHDDAIVHPSSFASRRDDFSAAKISEMAGDLRLGSPKNLDEIAHTNLLVAHEVQESEASVVSERLEEPFHTKSLFRCHEFNIYALTYSLTSNIVA